MQFSKSKLSPLKAWKYLIKKPVSLNHDQIFLHPREASDRYRGFHINHQDKCTGCGTCSEICPTDAINLVEVPGREAYDGRTNQLPTFDYGRCSFCGLCVDICTSDSLRMTKEYIHVSTDLDSFMFMPDELGIHGVYYADGYTRDKNSELLDLDRYPIEEISHEGRNTSFIELIKGFSKDMALAETARCVECGICTDTCPANMNIPEYIKAIFNEKLDEGLELIYNTNPLPHVCGRICTHKCETACVLSNRGEAVSIRWLKRYIVDNITDVDYQNKIINNLRLETKSVDKKVAIVGSGPAGLSAAYYLRTLGYNVTVFESKPLAGGVVRYGAPEYRLPDRAVTQDIENIRKIGVDIQTSTTIGTDISLLELKENYDAVFIGTGFWLPKKLNILNNDHPDIIYSTDFLSQSRDYTRGLQAMPEIHEKMIVIGGGDVSFDVARTLVRLQNEKYGKNHVEFIARKDEEHLAASLDEKVEAKQEDVRYNLNASPTEVVVDEQTNQIIGVKVAESMTRVNGNGKAITTTDCAKTHFIEGTQVYFAIGSDPDYCFLEKAIGESLKLNKNKLVVKDNGQIKDHNWLFAGGDIINGPDIISAIADGHHAAKGIDEYLNRTVVMIGLL